MIKFSVSTLMCFVFLSFFSLSQAIPITNLLPAELDNAYNTDNYSGAVDQLTANLLGVNYIEYDGLDWAWVSPVNVELYNTIDTSTGLSIINTLYAPELQENWRFASEAELTILKTDVTLDKFIKVGGYIQATQFFNSYFDFVDDYQFVPTKTEVSSHLLAPNNPLINFFNGYETFYVRDTVLATQVPEPTTLMIFTLGLIALVSKKRLL